MLPSFAPETYQAVKEVLRAWTALILMLFTWAFYGLVLPPEHRVQLASFVGKTDWNKPLALLEYAGLGVVAGVIGWILIYFFEIHDKIYDKYIVHWRRSYALDFIIPRLAWPFQYKVDLAFLTRAEAHPYDYMKILFYEFVGDREGKNRIKKNTILRFYEQVTKYWVTQLIEMFLILFFIAGSAYVFIREHMGYSTMRPVVFIMVLAVCFVLNRLLIGAARDATRKATLDEIEEIHRDFPKVLDAKLKELHDKLGMRYGTAKN